MFVLKCQDDLVLLQKELESLLPVSLKVYGALLNICQRNTFQEEALVDSWPKFNVVLVRPIKKQGESNDFDRFSNSYAYFYKDLERIPPSFLEAIDWTQAFLLRGLQCGLVGKIEDAARERQTRLEVMQFLTFWHKKETNVPMINVREGIKPQLCSLSLSHAQLVDENWAYGGKMNSIKYVKSCIKNAPSVCCMDKGSPVSWVLADQYGTMHMAFTKLEFRRKNYGKMVWCALLKILKQGGSPTCCHISKDNNASIALVRSLGFEEVNAIQFFISTPV